MIRPIIAAIGWFALSGLAYGQSLDTLPLFGTTASGVESVLAHGRHWTNGPCVPLGTAVVITQRPTHGTVRVVNEIEAVPKSTPRGGSTGYCAGMLLYGKKILYRSEPGFAGTDTLSYESVGSNGQRAPYNVTVTVTAE